MFVPRYGRDRVVRVLGQCRGRSEHDADACERHQRVVPEHMHGQMRPNRGVAGTHRSVWLIRLSAMRVWQRCGSARLVSASQSSTCGPLPPVRGTPCSTTPRHGYTSKHAKEPATKTAGRTVVTASVLPHTSSL